MVMMKDVIMTVSVEKDNARDSNGVIKRQVGNQTYVGYLNPAHEQVITGEFGFFKVYDGQTLRREFRLKDQTTINLAFKYIRDLELEPNLETELQVFLLDIESVGKGRQK